MKTAIGTCLVAAGLFLGVTGSAAANPVAGPLIDVRAFVDGQPTQYYTAYTASTAGIDWPVGVEEMRLELRPGPGSVVVFTENAVEVSADSSLLLRVTEENCSGRTLSYCTVRLIRNQLYSSGTAFLKLKVQAASAPLVVGFILKGETPAPTPTPTPTKYISPLAPTELKVKATRKVVKASWRPASAVPSYSVSVSGRVGDAWRSTKTSSTTKNRYTLRVGLRPHSKFKVCVRSVSAEGLRSPRVCAAGRAPEAAKEAQ